MIYTHLSQEERYQIYALKKVGHDQSDIARILERNKSTVCRELKRNCGARWYRPKPVQELSLSRKSTDNVVTIHADTWASADAQFVSHWST
jgi:IS30 family transposase